MPNTIKTVDTRIFSNIIKHIIEIYNDGGWEDTVQNLPIDATEAILQVITRILIEPPKPDNYADPPLKTIHIKKEIDKSHTCIDTLVRQALENIQSSSLTDTVNGIERLMANSKIFFFDIEETAEKNGHLELSPAYQTQIYFFRNLRGKVLYYMYHSKIMQFKNASYTSIFNTSTETVELNDYEKLLDKEDFIYNESLTEDKGKITINIERVKSKVRDNVISQLPEQQQILLELPEETQKQYYKTLNDEIKEHNTAFIEEKNTALESLAKQIRKKMDEKEITQQSIWVEIGEYKKISSSTEVTLEDFKTLDSPANNPSILEKANLATKEYEAALNKLTKVENEQIQQISLKLTMAKILQQHDISQKQSTNNEDHELQIAKIESSKDQTIKTIKQKYIENTDISSALDQLPLLKSNMDDTIQTTVKYYSLNEKSDRVNIILKKLTEHISPEEKEVEKKIYASAAWQPQTRNINQHIHNITIPIKTCEDELITHFYFCKNATTLSPEHEKILASAQNMQHYWLNRIQNHPLTKTKDTVGLYQSISNIIYTHVDKYIMGLIETVCSNPPTSAEITQVVKLFNILLITKIDTLPIEIFYEMINTAETEKKDTVTLVYPIEISEQKKHEYEQIKNQLESNDKEFIESIEKTVQEAQIIKRSLETEKHAAANDNIDSTLHSLEQHFKQKKDTPRQLSALFTQVFIDTKNTNIPLSTFKIFATYFIKIISLADQEFLSYTPKQNTTFTQEICDNSFAIYTEIDSYTKTTLKSLDIDTTTKFEIEANHYLTTTVNQVTEARLLEHSLYLHTKKTPLIKKNHLNQQPALDLSILENIVSLCESNAYPKEEPTFTPNRPIADNPHLLIPAQAPIGELESIMLDMCNDSDKYLFGSCT